jgi:hypothetical protein
VAANVNANGKKRKKHAATPAMIEAGRQNIVRFNQERGGRPNQSHGVHSVLRSKGKFLPAGCEGFASEVDAIVSEMADDLGGASNLTGAQKSLLESQRLCLLVLKVAGGHIRAQGLLTKRGKPNSLLLTITSFANTLRHNATVLGLERKPRKIGPSTLAEYLDAKPSEDPSAATEPVQS